MTSTLTSRSHCEQISAIQAPSTTPGIVSDSDKTVCFESLPAEVRNKIYRYLFSLQDARVRRWGFGVQREAYVFPTAILRTSRMIHQEAQAVLYSDNLLVLLGLDTSFWFTERLFKFAKNVPINLLGSDAPMPPAAVHIKHRIEDKSDFNKGIVFGSSDFDLVCHALHEVRRSNCSPYQRWSITLLEVPRRGWTSDRLKTSIWDPLKRRQFGLWDYVMDRTGLFETRTEEPDTSSSFDIERYSDGDNEDQNGDGDEDGDEYGGKDGDGDGDEDGDKYEDGDEDEGVEGDGIAKRKEEEAKNKRVNSKDQEAVCA